MTGIFLMRKLILFLVLSLSFIYGQQPDKTPEFVDIQKMNPSIILDIRYATSNNFLHRAVYDQARCFLVKEAALKLNEVQKELQTLGLGLKIFDAYRPLSVQKAMWQIMPDARYVANPAKGSRHNRGCAVDLTLVDSTGKELPMPTEYDDFTKRAHHNYMKLPASIRLNRWILKTVMEKHGFKPISSEWWHYDMVGWQKYPVMDLSFSQIDSMLQK
ncbi:D-alanyl-D-alanine dipeptidase [Caldithrix abyssi DSM 13497]|uniref:D-alanyl-D-alanine dipeptidase n=2 Tax=Caldithrix abyssi DSM 13497 TaxID=880073 RepID=A0A1J1C4A9_CALAY|nr:D-alanyl-D-alanine dipeptidase [Caldithrix abyssi DSM 13497]